MAEYPQNTSPQSFPKGFTYDHDGRGPNRLHLFLKSTTLSPHRLSPQPQIQNPFASLEFTISPSKFTLSPKNLIKS